MSSRGERGRGRGRGKTEGRSGTGSGTGRANPNTAPNTTTHQKGPSSGPSTNKPTPTPTPPSKDGKPNNYAAPANANAASGAGKKQGQGSKETPLPSNETNFRPAWMTSSLPAQGSPVVSPRNDMKPAWLSSPAAQDGAAAVGGLEATKNDMRPAWMKTPTEATSSASRGFSGFPSSLSSAGSSKASNIAGFPSCIAPLKAASKSTPLNNSNPSKGSASPNIEDPTMKNERRREQGEIKGIREGFGFLWYNGKSIFFKHTSNCDISNLREGDKVDFFISPDPKIPGDIIATHVRLLSSSDPIANITTSVNSTDSEYLGVKEDLEKYSRSGHTLKFIEQFENLQDSSSILFQKRDLESILLKSSLHPKFIRKFLSVVTSPEFRSSERTEPIFRVIVDSNFIKNPNNMSSYILKLTSLKAQDDIYGDPTQALKNVIYLMEELFNRYPFEYSKFPLDSLENILHQKNDHISPEILLSIKKLLEKKKAARSQATKQALQEDPLSKPTDEKRTPKVIRDFRDLPIFPETSEILAEPKDLKEKLSKNIVSGAYENVMQYLDTHFRLLREDCITSIRDGIVAYRKDKNAKTDLAFYTDVRVVGIQCSREGIIYRLSFQIDCDVAWNRTKRLMYGSLLCLSPDNFETLLWVTVASRDLDLLSTKQQVDIRAPYGVISKKEFPEFGNIITPRKFTMVESTSTYFEAYQHILSALQRMEINKFPFVNHLIRCEKEVAGPQYLTLNNSVYKLENVFDGGKREFSVIGKWPDIKEDQEDEEEECVETTMDSSQLDAFKRALSKNFALIQGPPGTGKTFVGLKVVRALLDNKEVREKSGSSGPILVICYTNHALDQFLEGVLSFEKNLVRIGSRSKSTLLAEYNLREKIFESSEVSIAHKKAKRQITEKLKELEEEISTCFFNLTKFELTREDLEDLKCSDSQLDSLYSRHKLDEIELVLKEWLGYPPKDTFNSIPKLPKPQKGLPKNKHKRDTEAEMDEELIQLTQNERMVDFEEDKNQMYQMTEDVIDMTKVQTPPTHILSCYDLWTLSKPDRKLLYMYWLKTFREEQSRNLQFLCKQFESSTERRKQIEDELKVSVLSSANVIGMTTTGMAKFQKLIQAVRPSILVVEEAAEVLEAHIITALSQTTKHLILIGDHEQLRPTTAVHELSTQYHLDVSLFERMIINGVEHSTLLRQRRMRPAISELISPIYPKLYNHPDVTLYPFVKGVKDNLFFLSHNYPESNTAVTKSNPHEANFLVRFCRYLLLQGYAPNRITILTAYSGQVKLIREQLKYLKSTCDWSDCKEERNDMFMDKVYVTSVDNYQGEENDIILLSLVRSNTKGVIGFLNTSNRICVALSRAKHGMFIIGNAELLSKKNTTWNSIIQILKKRQLIGTSLTLSCQNHPQQFTKVVEANDFKDISEGGCKQACLFRMSCGHLCPKRCHPYSHDDMKCLKEVSVKRECGHNSDVKLCFEDLFPCEELVLRKLPCGHEQHIECYKEDWQTVPCESPCSRLLKCGHLCPLVCSQRCPKKCTTTILKELPCGHTARTECWQTSVLILCGETHDTNGKAIK